MKKYQILYADPPWNYNDQGCQGTMANHYRGMKLKDIKNLDIESICDKDCVLFMWVMSTTKKPIPLGVLSAVRVLSVGTGTRSQHGI